MNNGHQIVLGVTGSIAASKAVELCRLLVEAGCGVSVIQSPASRNFVSEADFELASGQPVLWDQFASGAAASSQPDFAHIDLARRDLLLIAPATANTIGKMASGIADNLLLSTYLACDCPVVVCPAMNHRMWEHPAVRHNLQLLEERGVIVVPPGTGKLACGEEGPGRLAEPQDIFALAMSVLGKKPAGDLVGLNVLVTAGGTREPLDSVRFITNRSSGKMGFALAERAFRRGASVTVIAANCSLPHNPGIHYIDVVTSSDLAEALKDESGAYDILLMAAAVSDYKVSGRETTGKIERVDKINLQLVPTSDIVSSLGTNVKSGIKVGFAAEYGEDKKERARGKLKQKNLDMIVFNDISRSDTGFESDDNEITIMTKDRGDVFVSKATKAECAERILDQVAELLS
jgi:phosphopantothenoylcysteine decarboxylase/phosphopantothenate--cysteine ligase